jgi:hypothetical protein
MLKRFLAHSIGALMIANSLAAPSAVAHRGASESTARELLPGHELVDGRFSGVMSSSVDRRGLGSVAAASLIAAPVNLPEAGLLGNQ